MNMLSSGYFCTCGLCLERPRGETGVAETHSIEGEDSEHVVGVGWQFEVSCRSCSRDLGEIVPVTSVVQRVFILDEECCAEQKGIQVFYSSWLNICLSVSWNKCP